MMQREKFRSATQPARDITAAPRPVSERDLECDTTRAEMPNPVPPEHSRLCPALPSWQNHRLDLVCATHHPLKHRGQIAQRCMPGDEGISIKRGACNQLERSAADGGRMVEARLELDVV